MVKDLTGRRFGYRERRTALGTPVAPVEVVKMGPKPSRQVRIRWLAGEWDGLEAWVPRQRLVVPWEDAQAFIEDEERFLQVYEASHAMEGSPLHNAVGLVLGVVTADVWFGVTSRERAVLRIERVADAAAELRMTLDELLAEPLSYLDRHGVYRAPFATAEKMARAVCRADAQRVLAEIARERDAHHKALLTGVYEIPGTSHTDKVSRATIEQWVAEHTPAWDLVTQWCGAAARDDFDEVVALRTEVTRLRKQIEHLADWLRVSGHPVKAALVRKALNETGVRES